MVSLIVIPEGVIGNLVLKAGDISPIETLGDDNQFGRHYLVIPEVLIENPV